MCRLWDKSLYCLWPQHSRHSRLNVIKILLSSIRTTREKIFEKDIVLAIDQMGLFLIINEKYSFDSKIEFDKFRVRKQNSIYFAQQVLWENFSGFVGILPLGIEQIPDPRERGPLLFRGGNKFNKTPQLRDFKLR